MSYAAIYDPDTDLDRIYTDATAAAVAAAVAPGERVLELGCATGRMTAWLAGAGACVTAVDREPAYIERLRSRGLDGVGCAVVDLDREPLPEGPFDHVVMTNLLHEVADPHALLGAAAVCGGRVHVTLQNPLSLHRLVAFEMGLIDDLEAVSERGARYGTTRLWSADALAGMLAGAGLRVVHRTGLVLKPLPNALLAQLPADVLDGLAAAGRHVPEHAAITYLTGVPA